MLSWFAIVTIIIGAFNTRSIMLSGKLPPVVSWRFRPYAEITKYSIKYSTYAAVRNASSPLGISSASRRFMVKPVPIRLSPKASRMLPFGGEDTKRNFKHAKRLQLRPELIWSQRRRRFPAVIPRQKDVFPAERRPMREITGCRIVTLLVPVIDGALQVPCIP